MGLITEVTVLDIEGEDPIAVSASITDIVVQDAFVAPDLTLTPATGPEIVEVQVAGPQGPAGLQNVYVQENDPAVEFGWGAEEEGFIWAQIL
jgi:hypothetical protein